MLGTGVSPICSPDICWVVATRRVQHPATALTTPRPFDKCPNARLRFSDLQVLEQLSLLVLVLLSGNAALIILRIYRASTVEETSRRTDR